MPRGGRIGPPHITRSRSSFNALDMFKKLFDFTTPAAGADSMVFEAATTNMVFESGDNMTFEN